MSISKKLLIPLLGITACTGNQPNQSSDDSKSSDDFNGKKPNILFISIDDLNDWIGCLDGDLKAKTPNLDRLARMGVNFTHAYCAAPSCGPSRASLMTGIAPYSSGMYINKQPTWENPILQKAITLPQYLRKYGYRATGTGKIYHYGSEHPNSWDYYYPKSVAASSGTNKIPDPEPKELQAVPVAGGAFDWAGIASDTAYGDYKSTTWAAEQLSKTHDQPFFLACGIWKPHLPWYVPQKYFDMYPLDSIEVPQTMEGDLDDIPDIGKQIAVRWGLHEKMLKHGKWKEAVQAYLACISFGDAMLGRLLDAYDNSPEKDNTIIVLWSDHGYHLGEKKHWHKFTVWEEAAHSVFMFAGPGIVKGKTCNTPVSLMDVYPTLLDLCNLPTKEKLDGKSIKSLLLNKEEEWNDSFAITTYGFNNHGIRTKDFRYIHYRDGAEELYDHRVDKMEWYNLAGKPEYAEILTEMREKLPEYNAEFLPKIPKSENNPVNQLSDFLTD